MKGLGEAAFAQGGLVGTWVKIASLETVELLGHAGFDFVVVDMEHAPHTLETTYRLVFAAQAMGMRALVRLPDRLGSDIQRLLDAGVDGLLVPQVPDLDTAARVTRQMVFAPEGERGLGATSRAGRWGLLPAADYVRHGNEQCLRMIQLEEWNVLQSAASFLALEHVGGVFVGLGDLWLSSSRKPDDGETQAMVADVARAAREAGKFSGIAAGSVAEARTYLDLGYSLVMVSNDATMFGRAAAATVSQARNPQN
jgi:2-dehydro-3-deoxyglucarate aldolase/4-hydroxy-2-oxoheptanedioate aldolase